LLAKAELNYYPEEILEREDKKNERNNKRNNRKRNRRNKKKSSFKMTSIIVAILLMCSGLLILRRYANISKMRMEVTELEKQKTELEKERLSLTSELEGMKNGSKISKDAIEKLGMSYPQKDQVVYISVEDIVNEETKNTKFDKYWDKVLSVFSRLF